MEVPTFFSSSLSNRKPEAGADVSWDNPTTYSASAYLEKNNDRFEDKLLSTERRDYIHLYLGKSLKTTRHEVLMQLIRHSVFMR